MNFQNENSAHLLLFLQDNFVLLKKAQEQLKISEKKCQSIKIDENLTNEDLEVFEAMTARFARAVDILTQKIYKTLLRLLHENFSTFIDLANFLEKAKVIENAEDLISLRILRNEIAHEYVFVAENIFRKTLAKTSILQKMIEQVERFVEKNF